ncbi:GNAT family N-acetyltransferase [Winogradskyella maritima]|uniref:GNAT family N-acetyltransferase n=1 Tax=Winogradskyella maritima TaxID=1517766 RepID=A0ABV8AD89_9FLAO|nr:GNAT family N-acetyltransferase [Winogradskyella maritima]
MLTITHATTTHLHDLTPLFDGYRSFYRQASDLDGAKIFLQERLAKKDAVIFIAYKNETPVGFTQLYPLFSSVSMQPMYLLNDLYIHPDYRSQGIGEALINKAKALCKTEGQKGLAIQTESDNRAQHLYQRLGFEPDGDLHFFWICA